MSKPLELVIHPKLQHRRHVTGGWLWDCEACNTVITGPSKRLTNAELAAEYWRAVGDESMITEGYNWTEMCGEWPVSEEEAIRRSRSLTRFATLPSYDEVPE